MKPSLPDSQYVACTSDDNQTYHAVFTDTELWESEYFTIFDLEEVKLQIENYIIDAMQKNFRIPTYWGILHLNTGKIVKTFKFGLTEID